MIIKIIIFKKNVGERKTFQNFIDLFFCTRVSSSGSSKFEVLRQPIIRSVVEDNVIRQPRGPDNTKGFNHRS